MQKSRIPRLAVAALGIFRRAAAACAVASATALVIGTALPAQAATPGWRQVFSKHYGATANISAYDAVAALSEKNVWVLGGTNTQNGYAPAGKPVAVHWDGETWRSAALPSQATGYVFAASATSASDIWAITQYSAYVLHWNGEHWSVARHLPANGGEVTGITAISPTDVWVFGGGGVIGGIGTWHYNGKTWQQWKGNAAGLERGSAVSAKDIWAVGGPLSPDSALEHFNGKTWQFVTAKALSGLQFRDIAAFSSTDVWVGAESAIRGGLGWLMHYNGKTWARVNLPWQIDVTVPVADGHGGLLFTGNSSTGQRYIVHRSATGMWTRAAIPAVVPGGIEFIPGTASALAIGAKTVGQGSDAVIWAYGKI
jgi:hypothetical protein